MAKEIAIDDRFVTLQVRKNIRETLYNSYQIWDTAGQERFQSLGRKFIEYNEILIYYRKVVHSIEELIVVS